MSASSFPSSTGFSPEYANMLRRMNDVGLPTRTSNLGAEELPVVANSYLEASRHVFERKEPNTDLSVRFPQIHQERSAKLAGTFVTMGPEQYRDSVKDYVERKRLDNLEALVKSEESVTAETRRMQSFLAPDLEWEKFKEEMLLSAAVAGTGGVVEVLRNQRLKAMNPLSSGIRTLTGEEMMFARIIREFNEDILCSRPPTFDLTQKFLSAVDSAYDKTASTMWQSLATIVSRDLPQNAFQNVVDSYRLSAEFAKHVITKSKTFLEQSAYKVAQDRMKSPVRELEESYNDASDVVIPYTRMQLGRSKIKPETSGISLHGLPIWSLIYHALRLGALKTAISFCNQGDESTKAAARYLTEYLRNQGSLLATTQQEVRTAYFAHTSTSSSSASYDIYKRAVYGILSRAEPNQDFGGIIHSVGDWLWMKLAQTEFDPSAAAGGFSLFDLQKIVQSRFPIGTTDDIEAFTAFVLTGQFEIAVNRLFQNLNFRIHAVHMAIVLRETGLLSLATEPQYGAILATKSPLPSLDFSAIIRLYVSEFRKVHADVAMEYYFQLRDTPPVRSLHSEHNFRNLFEFCVYKLAKETDDTSQMFGKMGNGKNEPFQHGLIHKFIAEPADVICAVADDFIKDGRLEDGILLYEISGKRTPLIKTFLQIIPEELMFPASNSSRKTIKDLATRFAERYTVGLSDEYLVQNFFILLDLLTFFDYTNGQEDQKALLIMQRIKIIPLDPDEVEITLKTFRSNLSPEVRECIPHTALKTLQSLVNCYIREKELILDSRAGAAVGTPFKTANLTVSGVRLSDDFIKVQQSYRKQSRAILEFSSRIPSPQLPNLMDLLVKLDSLIV